MADFGAPVAQNVNVDPNRAVQTLAGLLSLKQQQQALQTGQFAQQSVAAQASLDQRVAQERQNLAGVNWEQFHRPDGSWDMDRLSSTANQAAPTTGQEFVSRFADMAKGGVEAKKSFLSLNDDYQKNLRSVMGTWAGDPKANIGELLDQVDAIKDTAPESSRKAIGKVANYVYGMISGPNPLTGAPKTLDEQKKSALNYSRAALSTESVSGAGGLATPGTGALDIGPAVQPTATNRMTGETTPAGPGFNKGLPPGANLVTDSFGRQYILNPQTNTVSPVGTGGHGQNQTSFTQPIADQGAALADLREVRAATAQGGVTRNVNQHLLDLSKETNTGGWGTEFGQKVAATLGLPSGSRFQEISAYLDRQAALQAQVMGVPHTNAGLAAAERATGTTDYTPQALQEKVKFFDALNSGAMAYRQGLDKAVGTGPTPDLTKYQAYRSAWAKNFDPDIFRAEDAQRRGDTAELESLKKRLGKKGMADLATKSANLRQLENGQIPND